jgi:hypothetical protein
VADQGEGGGTADPRPRSRRATLAAALALFVALALLTTWPLAAGMARDIPWELGDPLLNVWILGWDLASFQGILGGDAGALTGFWDANIFHPEPRALAYSEHLVPLAAQAFPVYALTGNVILCYNLLFLSAFVLSALGAFLLVRDLTGSDAAGLAAGLLFGFAPYRVEQSAHLQVITSQWMPFVLLGVLRFLESGRKPWLAVAGLALVAQNLSCAYYLLFFPPFVAAWVVWELAARGRLRDRSTWTALAVAGLAVAAATAPFVWPYAQVRAQGGIVRPGWELERFSADVYSYLTAPETLRFWGKHLRVFPSPEGSLFPGLVPVALAVLGVGAGLARAWRESASPAPEDEGRLLRIARVAAAAVTVGALAVVLVVLAGGGPVLSSHAGIRVRNLARPLWLAAASLGLLLVLSARARRLARTVGRAPFAFWLLALLLAAALSLGPTVKALGREVTTLAPYRLLYEHAPGYDGLRAPARFAMLVALFLSILAGLGSAALRRRRHGGLLIAAACILFVLEANPAPIVLNGVWGDTAYRKLPRRVALGAGAPPIYADLARLPRGSVLVHLPFGSGPWELRYMFHSLAHRHPLVNGMSGAFPASYVRNRAELRDPVREPDRAWRALLASGATHVVVHEGAWRDDEGRGVSARLEAGGARRLLSRDGDVLLVLPRPFDP